MRLLHGLNQAIYLDGIRVVFHDRFLLFQRDLGFSYAFYRFQCRLHCASASASSHTGDFQSDGLFFRRRQRSSHQQRRGQDRQESEYSLS